MYVAIGGATGSIARYLISLFVQARSTSTIPIGTLLINVAGSLLLGFILRYTAAPTPTSLEARALLATGFCGGFTTFSAFSVETLALLDAGDYRRAVAYVVLSVVFSVAGVFAGFALARGIAGHG
jgi:fluoride exporter